MKFEEEISKFTHGMEETFHDVKEHMITTVERHSLVIAMVLMSVTTAVLVIGTVYVWCFHHPSSSERSRPVAKKKKEASENGRKESSDTQEQKSDEKDTDAKSASSHDIINDTEQHSLEEKEESQEAVPGSEEKSEDVRKRIPSSSGNVNNNDSPTKSKIPVMRRSISRTKQS